MFVDRYASCYDLFNSDKKYKKEIQFVHRWAERPKTILDIGCGTASYWKYFPHKVCLTGLEQSPAMINRSPSGSRINCGNVRREKFSKKNKFDCVTALFDVINYIPDHSWWNRLPIKKGGYLIFDIWDKEKVLRDGFDTTIKRNGFYRRIIDLISFNGFKATLEVDIRGWDNGEFRESENHTMYIWSEGNIRRFARKSFEIVEIKKTKKWQTWYKLRKK